MADSLTAEQAAEAEEIILGLMRKPFTYRSLWASADAQMSLTGGQTSYRLADRLIQRERKAGRIRMLPGRKGWEPVEQAA